MMSGRKEVEKLKVQRFKGSRAEKKQEERKAKGVFRKD
jgi:hypothetical protein